MPGHENEQPIPSEQLYYTSKLAREIIQSLGFNISVQSNTEGTSELPLSDEEVESVFRTLMQIQLITLVDQIQLDDSSHRLMDDLLRHSPIQEVNRFRLLSKWKQCKIVASITSGFTNSLQEALDQLEQISPK